MAGQPNAILAISSTDRYITYSGGKANQPRSDSLLAQYNARGPYSNDFSITAPGALMNGYIDKIVISQIQLQYNLPTIQPGNNDILTVVYETGTQTGVYVFIVIPLPYGFYTPEELAAMLDVQLTTYIPSLAPWVVTYSASTSVYGTVGYQITSESPNFETWFFPSPDYLQLQGISQSEIKQVLKTYRLFGFNAVNSELLNSPSVFQQSHVAPEFLYTPYIDIYSDALTNYQKLKDTNSSTIRAKGLIARLYLSGVGNPQTTSPSVLQNTTLVVPSSALGCNPFVLTFDLNSPKIINWSPDTAINSLDFQMRDCYGDLLFVYDTAIAPGQAADIFNTEFQMTLLCVETD
jgi:hypothetical protein